jgi:A/G-specific adenine glycosylase
MIAALDRKNPREWYWALMDYGAHLKKNRGNASRRSKHHVRQKPFKGSDREVRGAILRTHLKGGKIQNLPFPKKRLAAQLKKRRTEGLI